MTTEKAKSLQAILDKKVDGKKIFGTSFALNSYPKFLGNRYFHLL